MFQLQKEHTIFIKKQTTDFIGGHTMKRLGISVYPSHSSMDEIIEYVELAAKYGFKRIFT